MSCVLSHPASGQTLILESGRPALLYTALSDLNNNLTNPAGARLSLKSYSNLYLLESSNSSNNIYPSIIGFVPNSGLPNGLVLHNYNTITGIVRTTGLWRVATQYFYPHAINPVTKIFNILVNKTCDPNSYAFQNFETLFMGNDKGQPVFPQNGLNGLEVPTIQNNQIVFIPTGQIIGPAPFIGSEGLAGGADEDFVGIGIGRGDPINTIVARTYTNLLTDENGIITGVSGAARLLDSTYIDTRTRAENLFLGRIGNRYVRVDTQTLPSNFSAALGTINSIKLSQGILGISGSSFLPYGFETNSTTYFVTSGAGRTAVIRQDKNAPAFNFTPIPNVENMVTLFQTVFTVRQRIGIGDVTAFDFAWQISIDPNELTDTRSIQGGSYSVSLENLHDFDEVGGSLINHLNFMYNQTDYNAPASTNCSQPVLIRVSPQISGNWGLWGRNLSWKELSPKAKHFLGLDWSFRMGLRQESAPATINIVPKWKRADPDWEGYDITLRRNIFPFCTAGSECGGRVCAVGFAGRQLIDTALVCPPCDPSCEGFNGDPIAIQNAPLGCAGRTPINQALANCFGLADWSPNDCPGQPGVDPATDPDEGNESPSTTSSARFSQIFKDFLLSEI